MSLCGYKTDVCGRGVMTGGGCPPWKDIKRREDRAGQAKNKYVTIRNVA